MRAGSLSSPLFSSLRRRPMSDRRIRPDPTAEQIEIDIATGEHEADVLDRQPGLFLKRRSERGGASAFGEIMRVGPVGADRGGDLVVGDLHDVRSALANNGE